MYCSHFKYSAITEARSDAACNVPDVSRRHEYCKSCRTTHVSRWQKRSGEERRKENWRKKHVTLSSVKRKLWKAQENVCYLCEIRRLQAEEELLYWW